MAHGGAALGRAETGQVVFVDDALPGERVLAEPLARRSRFMRARAARVLSPAAGRVDPPCPYVPECGGCQWQHASYQTQLELKVRILAQLMERAGAVVPPPDVLPAPDPWRYRIRGEFHLVPDGSPGLGFNRRRSYDLVAVEDCLIHNPHITEALPAISDALYKAGAGSARGLRLTASPDRRELLWQATGGAAAPGLAEALAERLSGYVVHQDSLSLSYSGGLVDGRGEEVIFRVDSESFVQVNHAQAHYLYGRALSYLGETPGSLVEAYSGFGALSILALTRDDPATRPTRAVMIETSRAAVIMARLHARLHGVEDSVRVLPGRVEDRLAELEPGTVDTFLADPPRAGLSDLVVGHIARLRPRRLVYVSCDPATLGRDLALLGRSGYEVTAQSLVDMFPQTYHIETVTLLQLASSGPVIT